MTAIEVRPFQKTLSNFFKTGGEEVDGVGIGRETLPFADLKGLEFSPELCALLNILNKPEGNETRRRLCFHLGWNTTDPFALVPYDRPVSAYFTYNPNNQVLIIEWGLIDPKSNEAKLHDYLNRSLNLNQRSNDGMKISSGHLAKLTGTNKRIALVDNLSHETPAEEITLPMKRIINTFYNHKIIPITAEGYVRLPIF
jgi:hypothetical protein